MFRINKWIAIYQWSGVVIIVIDLVELNPIQWGVAVITPFGRPGDVQFADSRPLRVEG